MYPETGIKCSNQKGEIISGDNFSIAEKKSVQMIGPDHNQRNNGNNGETDSPPERKAC